MNKKTITLIALGISIAAITYITYRSLGQLQDIDYDLFNIEEDIDSE